MATMNNKVEVPASVTTNNGIDQTATGIAAKDADLTNNLLANSLANEAQIDTLASFNTAILQEQNSTHSANERTLSNLPSQIMNAVNGQNNDAAQENTLNQLQRQRNNNNEQVDINPLNMVMQLQMLRQDLTQLANELRVDLNDKQLTSAQIATIKHELADIAAIQMALNELLATMLSANPESSSTVATFLALSGAYLQAQATMTATAVSGHITGTTAIAKAIQDIKLAVTNISANMQQMSNWQPLLQLSTAPSVTQANQVSSTQNYLANLVTTATQSLSATLAQVDNPTKSLLVTLALAEPVTTQNVLKEVQGFFADNPQLSEINAFQAFACWQSGVATAGINQATLQFASQMGNLFIYMDAKLAEYNQVNQAAITVADLVNDSSALASDNVMLGGLTQQQFLQFILYDEMMPTAMQTALIGEDLVQADKRKSNSKSRQGTINQRDHAF